MTEDSPGESAPDASSGGTWDRPARGPDAVAGSVVAGDGGRETPPDAGLVTSCLEYVTFGYGVHHLLKVVLLQFVVLFLDVDLLAYTRRTAASTRPWYVTVTWVVASVVFLAILTMLVRRIGRRSLTPRFHRTPHLVASVVGYLVASGLSFLFGYVTFVVPVREDPLALPAVLPSWLLTVVFATFIAIGYHAQVALTDQPPVHVVTDAVVGWLDAVAWVEAEPNSLARDEEYAEFVERSEELRTILSVARTAEGRRLERDFQEWCERFETRSMLSRELVVEGQSAEVEPENDRLAAEHEEFIDLRRQLTAIAGVELSAERAT